MIKCTTGFKLNARSLAKKNVFVFGMIRIELCVIQISEFFGQKEKPVRSLCVIGLRESNQMEMTIECGWQSVIHMSSQANCVQIKIGQMFVSKKT